MTESKRLVIVVGPTATGKTSLALDLARRFDGEIVGADAFQVYRLMDVGTAKPTAPELEGVVHHLIDVAWPDEPFHAQRYLTLADAAVADILSRGKTVIVAGGTGLYVRALVRGLAKMPQADPVLREALTAEAQRAGPEALHQKLAHVDPEYAARVGARDMVRIVRALEVYKTSGRTMTEVHAEHSRQPDRYETLWLGLDPGQQPLRERISRRTAAMFRSGFVAEVEHLLDGGYGPDLPPMRALGYKPVCEHLAGQMDLSEAQRVTERDTARYAKRQRTWFRAEPHVRWIAQTDHDVAEMVETFLG